MVCELHGVTPNGDRKTLQKSKMKPITNQGDSLNNEIIKQFKPKKEPVHGEYMMTYKYTDKIGEKLNKMRDIPPEAMKDIEQVAAGKMTEEEFCKKYKP